MIIRSLKDIGRMTQGSLSNAKYDHLIIRGVSTDTRDIEDDQLFIPLIGANFNAHRFVQEAMDRGASAALWTKDEPLPDIDFPFIVVDDTLLALQRLAKEYRKQLDVKVIGITGSNGKTTTKDILAGILATRYNTKKTIGNLNNHIGMPLTLLDLDEDTEMAVVEMGTSDFGEISLLTDIARPDIAIITNIGEAHLEGFLTRENIAKAKLEILEGLAPDGLFIYFGDWPILKELITNIELEQSILSYGIQKHNDYICELGQMDQNGLSFDLKAPIMHNLFVPILGAHNMYNTVAAVIAARHLDISMESIQEGLYHIDRTGMRNELVYAKGFTILDDSYKSNPDSVLAALDTLYSMEQYEQKIVVLGDMLGLGEMEVEMHEDIGRNIDPNRIEYIFTIGPLAEHIGKAAKINFRDDRIVSCNNKPQLIRKLREVLRPGSLVLVKASRALELEDVVNSLRDDIIPPRDEVI
ncbi:MAG: UDP-N-acetylmuramoyl-tripeptide--D-alanyl-D-alanine ligase [Tissierellia bacterium]|nr:UDP-N-acetylmuramoyl-tripeptide--D-alanyl-D-alanine ligase [Tissierellia bacterium]